jgi:hypothetical protein
MQKFEIEVRLPQDAKDWLVDEAEQNASSQRSEIVHALRARMARHLSEEGVPARRLKRRLKAGIQNAYRRCE